MFVTGGAFCPLHTIDLKLYRMSISQYEELGALTPNNCLSFDLNTSSTTTLYFCMYTELYYYLIINSSNLGRGSLNL